MKLKNTCSTAGLFICGVLCTVHVSAGPLFYTDDAKLADAAHCHVEFTRLDLKSSNTDTGLSTACGVSDQLEISMGVSGLKNDMHTDRQVSVQLKHLFRPLVEGQWGVAASMNAAHDVTGDTGTAWTLNVPLTRAVYNGQLLLNANIGYSYDIEHDYMISGVSAEFLPVQKHTFGVEVFNADRQSAFYQFAYEYELFEGVLTVGVSYASRFSHSSDAWTGLGFTFTPDVF